VQLSSCTTGRFIPELEKMAINFQRVAPLQSFKDEKLRQSGPFQRSAPPMCH